MAQLSWLMTWTTSMTTATSVTTPRTTKSRHRAARSRPRSRKARIAGTGGSEDGFRSAAAHVHTCVHLAGSFWDGEICDVSAGPVFGGLGNLTFKSRCLVARLCVLVSKKTRGETGRRGAGPRARCADARARVCIAFPSRPNLHSPGASAHNMQDDHTHVYRISYPWRFQSILTLLPRIGSLQLPPLRSNHGRCRGRARNVQRRLIMRRCGCGCGCRRRRRRHFCRGPDVAAGCEVHVDGPLR